MSYQQTNQKKKKKKGKGFCQTVKNKNGNTRETASTVYAELFRKLYASDEPLFVNFLNKLFNHSNWTVTELEASMRDVQPSPPYHTTSHLTTPHHIPSHYITSHHTTSHHNASHLSSSL